MAARTPLADPVTFNRSAAMPTRVLQLMSNPAVGGTETFVLGITPRLRAAGLDVQIVNLWDGGGELADMCADAGLPCDVLDTGRQRFRPGAPAMLTRYLLRGRYDVVAVYGLRASLLLRVVWAFAGRPAIVHGLRGLDSWKRWFHTAADRLTQHVVDRFVGVSQAASELRLARERTARSRVITIPNGIDLEAYAPQQAPASRSALGLPDGPFCVTVANLREVKGHAFQIDVIARTPRLPPDFRFVWVGDGPDRASLEARVVTAGLADRVVFLGARHDIQPILASAEMFFLSSINEGMPRALMEAMAMGLPVLSTRAGGAAEVVRDEIDGFLVQHGDVAAAAARLQQIVDDADLRARMGRAARQRICSAFSMDAIAQRYVSLFRDLVAERQRRLQP